MKREWRLRPMEKGDLPAVAALEKCCFSMPWSMDSLLYALTVPGGLCWVVTTDAEDGREICLGYAIARCIFENCELLNIAVERSVRRQGLGLALLDRIMAKAAEAGCTALYLEVRESNGGARALYAKKGFRAAGRRRDYYHLPKEDALLMTAALQEDGETGNKC